jgi:putative membrane protein
MLINRRNVIIATAALPLISAVAPLRMAMAASMAKPDFSGVKTVKQFGDQVIGRAVLSQAASEVAVKKAARADAKEFAALELMEANTVIALLKELGTTVPDMDAASLAAYNSIKNSAQGHAFDRAYIGAEYQNHAVLRDLAAAYLQNSDANTSDADEKHGRHLASLALFAFTEHTVITKRINDELSA